MKELTIEEKAKAYDEALKVLHKYDGANIMFSQSLKEEMFPELRESESEDEKVRKELLQWLKDKKTAPNIGFSDEKMTNWIAWLEKVGEIVDYYEDKLDKCACDYFNKGYKKALEKQGEQEETLCDKCKKEQPSHSCQDITALGRCALEMQSEQKPADKVESHFHVEKGKWYMCIKNNVGMTKGNVYYGISDGYIIDNNGMKHNCNNWAVFQRYLRLWTIQDAKDGDVLATEPIEGHYSPFIAIYKKQNEEDFDSYCFIGFDGKFYKGENGHSTEEIHPATKEQCDLLFQKMKEAGYEWNSEKKKLKKIEQNPAWSEEDEEMHRKCICAMRASACGFPEEEKFVEQVDNWLKSLKDRVQPRQEWDGTEIAPPIDSDVCG